MIIRNRYNVTVALRRAGRLDWTVTLKNRSVHFITSRSAHPVVWTVTVSQKSQCPPLPQRTPHPAVWTVTVSRRSQCPLHYLALYPSSCLDCYCPKSQCPLHYLRALTIQLSTSQRGSRVSGIWWTMLTDVCCCPSSAGQC
jgi:hypothetical protein